MKIQEKLKKYIYPQNFVKKVFSIIIICLIIPIYFIFLYLNHSFSEYLDEEISNKVTQSIRNSENEIYKKQENLINISSLFMSDSKFENIMTNDTVSYYDRCKYFDNMINMLTSSNVFNMEELKITFFDCDKNIYTNWSVNYHDYSFLLEKEWIKASQKQNGHINWDTFGKSPFIEDSSKDIRYISLARTFNSQSKKSVGTLIISMNSEVVNEILNKYRYSDKDAIFIYSPRENKVFNNNLTVEDSKQLQAILDNTDKKQGSFTTSMENNKYIISYYTLSNNLSYNNGDLKVVAMVDYQNVAEKTQSFMLKTTLFFLGFSIILLLLVYFIARTIVKPIKEISNRLATYSVGDVLELSYPYDDEIGVLYKTFSEMTYDIKQLFLRVDREYEIKEKYKFESLRAQINPHFLFNTINSIRWMAIIKKQDNIVNSIDALTDMLQYSMSKGSDFMHLEQELTSIKGYIYIQNMRYGENYELEIDLPDELYKAEMIKFSLQPIVENCIIHGFKELNGKGLIRITGYRSEQKMYLFVENNGTPISDEMIRKFEENKDFIHRDEKKVTGIGMTNVNAIINITYGYEYGLKVLRKDGKTVVLYTLPYLGENNK